MLEPGSSISNAFLLTSVLPKEHVHSAHWCLVRRYTGHSLKFTPYDTSILAYVNKNRIHYNYNMVVSLIQSVKKKEEEEGKQFQ